MRQIAARRNNALNEDVVIGIDPGSNTTGYAIMKHDFTLIDWGIITPPKKSLIEKSYIIGNGVKELIFSYKPSTLSIETQFVGAFRNACIPLSHIKGAIIYIAMDMGMSIHEFSASSCKKIFAGYGKASKEQIIKIVSTMFNLSVDQLEHNCADAIALAYCYIHNRNHNDRFN